MKRFTTFLLMLFGMTCTAQNLVPNGSFEQYTSCPNDFREIDSALYWINPSIVGTPPGGTPPGSPDYFNACGSSNVSVPLNFLGDQFAFDGFAYAGIFIRYVTGLQNFREYIETPFSSTLIAGECYHFSCYCSLADDMKYTTDNLGVYFSDTVIENITNHYPLPFNPQISNAPGNFFDTLNWTLVEGDYMAIGGENYIVIGNFNNDSTTDTLALHGSGQGNGSYLYIDSVSLVLTTCVTGISEVKQETVKVFPNPVSDKFTIQLSNNEPTEIILYDVMSRKLSQQHFTNSVSVNTEGFSKGIYFYEVRNRNGEVDVGKIIKE